MSKPLIRQYQHHLLAVLILLSHHSLALESDKKEKVQWSADGDSTMRIEGTTRILEMSTNVRVTQGTLEILGDEAIFEYSVVTKELNKVTVHGNPVQYQQQLDEDGNIVNGSSKTLSFYTDQIDGNTVLELVGDASIKSPDSTMNCSAITYIVDQDLIRDAAGPCVGALSSATN
jgi:lipopolysaccharide transport protein LptA